MKACCFISPDMADLATVPESGRTQLDGFLGKLTISELSEELWKATSDHPWVFVDLPTGSGKTLSLAGKPLVEPDLGETWVTEPTTASTMSIFQTLAGKLGQREGSFPWVGFGASGVAAYGRKTRVKIMTTGHAINWMLRIISGKTKASPSRVVLDEMHHPTTENWVAMLLMKYLVFHRDMDVKVVVSSATLNRSILNCPLLKDSPIVCTDKESLVPWPITVQHAEDPDFCPGYNEALAACVRLAKEALKTHRGSGIVFVAGEECAIDVSTQLKSIPDVEVLAVYANAPSYVLDTLMKAPEGKRRVYVCTNVAETGLTLPDAEWVVDSGYCKSVQASEMGSLVDNLALVKTSQANERQRTGRVGRCAPGYVYRAYGEAVQRSEHAPNEFEIMPPYGYMLKIIKAGLDPQELLEMPPERHERLMSELMKMGLVSDGAITSVGARVTSVPVSAPLAALLLHGSQNMSEATKLALCVFVALLDTGNTGRLFWTPPEVKRSAAAFRSHYRENYEPWVEDDDLEAFVRLIFHAFTLNIKQVTTWCRGQAFNDQIVKQVYHVTKQLVYHTFYCEHGSEKHIISQYAKRPDDVDYEALRYLFFDRFPERVVFNPVYTRGSMTYEATGGHQFTLDSKRRLAKCWMCPEPPDALCVMNFFQCDTRRGRLSLASCVIRQPSK